MHDDFRRALEEIKLRAPVEDVVREYVPELKKRGALWVACCPFHEERTPSFKVDPRRGTWHCFGACSEGGDQIGFVERMRNVGFRDAVEILAARAGVELPRARGARRDPQEKQRDQDALEALERATRFFEHHLAGAEGAAARAYLEQRGLGPEAVGAFRLGWAPAEGRALVDAATKRSIAFETLERAGLARRNDRGLPYDFFRGRLTIPIRDADGRVVGFGARRLGDEAGGPKYVNSPETPIFHKSRLIYGLDRGFQAVRRSGELVLVEGYTDVIAAHQAGVENVGAVLGTATTADHAPAVRRSGARRVALVFDGDAAGRKAAYKALDGLLALPIELRVVTLPAGLDPCDLLVREGAEGFRAALERGADWFDFLLEDLRAASGAGLSEGVDRALELLARIEKPVHREDLRRRLAAELGLPGEALDAQWRMHPAARRLAAAPAPEPPPAPDADGPEGQPADPPEDPWARRAARAFRELLLAALRDESLIPALRERVPGCPDAECRRMLEVLVELYDGSTAAIDEAAVLHALADHPARRQVVPLFEAARLVAAPRDLLQGNLEYLDRLDSERERRARTELGGRILELEEALAHTDRAVPDEPARLESVRAELEQLKRRYGELAAQGRGR